MAGAINKQFNVSEIAEKMKYKISKEKKILDEMQHFDERSEALEQFLREHSDFVQIFSNDEMKGSSMES